MSWRRKVAAVAAAGSIVAGCGMPLEHRPRYDTLAAEKAAISRLAHDTHRLKALSNTAIQHFQEAIAGENPIIWHFMGICAVMLAPESSAPKGQVQAAVIPDPGIIHATDRQSGLTFLQFIGWDHKLQAFITGETVLADSGHGGQAITPARQQYNIIPGPHNIEISPVTFSGTTGEVVLNRNDHPVMDVEAILDGSSVAAIAKTAAAKQACSAENYKVTNPALVALTN